MKEIKTALLIKAFCFASTLAFAQAETNIKRFYFTFNGGFFAGDALGYTLGASAGIRLTPALSLSFNVQQLISHKALMDEEKLKYDRLDFRMYSLKGFIDLYETGKYKLYLGVGAGYAASPHARGTDKDGVLPLAIGYYDSYFFNPGLGIEFPLGRTSFFFTEFNYNYHHWTRVHNHEPGLGLEAKKFAQVVYLTAGIKL
jgi:hypothetical protein